MIDVIITGDLGVNTYLYNFKDNRVVIIDPGANANGITDKINSKNQAPEAILLTHGHFDHIGAIKELAITFGIPVYIHKADATFLGPKASERHMEMFSSMGPQGSFYYDTYFTECDSPDFLLEDNQDLSKFNLKVIHTPGHSPGGACFYSEKNGIIFSGDTLFNGGLGRTDFVGGNYNTLVESLNKLFTLPGDTIVYPGHGSKTTISAEK